MEALRTPDQRFAGLSAFPYPVRSVDVGEELRMAYVAEGPREQQPVLLLHGGPTWSYLWRHVIPMLAEAGSRVFAFDLVGFGRSDKPRRARDLGLERQLGWVAAAVEQLDVNGAFVVAHGFSAALGLRLLGRAGQRFRGAALVCPVLERGPEVDLLCRRLREDEDLPVADLVADGCAGPLSPAARAAYAAPFPDDDYLRAVRALPDLIPEEADPAEELAAAGDRPLLVVAGEKDALAVPLPVDGENAPPRAERTVLAGAGHHAPEDRGSELALALLGFLERNGRP